MSVDVVPEPPGQDQSCSSVETFLVNILNEEMTITDPSLVRLSLALGFVETAWTCKPKTEACLPENLVSFTQKGLAVFDEWVATTLSGVLRPDQDTRSKVQTIAGDVWARLKAKSFNKEVLHAQHLSNFVALVDRQAQSSVKRQLDCAGVVTTVLCACFALATRFPDLHEDLGGVRMQLSEDHCWLSLDGSGSRVSSCEVTTVSSVERGRAVSPEAWHTWLYAGGSGTLLTRHQVLTAMVVATDATIFPAKGKRSSARENQSLELERVQRTLLQAVKRQFPQHMYPAAILSLAALTQAEFESLAKDGLDAMDADATGAEVVCFLLPLVERWNTEGAMLLEEAAQAYIGAKPQEPANSFRTAGIQPNGRTDLCRSSVAAWYPCSTYASILFGQAEWLADNLSLKDQEDLGNKKASDLFVAGLQQLRCCANVLRSYRFSVQDEALHKDADRLLASFEDAAGGVASLSPDLLPQLLDSPNHIETLLSLVDAICAYFGSRSKPGSWMTLLLRLITSHSSPETRKTAVECVELSGCHSRVFHSTLGLWGDSSNSRLLKSLLEAPEPAGEASGEGTASRRKRARTVS